MSHTIKRRDFLKVSGTVTSVLTLSPSLFTLNSCKSRVNNKPLYDLFYAPYAEAKPFYRWWWNGNRVTKEGVERELEIMKSAGAGGVEINPIELNKALKNPTGIALDWMSKEWIEVLKASVKKGNDLGMITDMIIGTGWPFGGRFLEDNETIQGHDIYTKKISGPALFEFDKKNLHDNAVIKQAKLIPVPVNDLSEMMDITEDVNSGFVTIPEGEFEISVISWRNKFRDVMFGAPGADGPVLDHFNKAAVEKYLKRTEDGLKPTFGENLGKHIRSVFCDSIELEGANWTNDFREEFQTRNGYDIWEYLPLIMNEKTEAEGDFEDTILRARYDYYNTLSELFMERFVLPYHEWCHKTGTKSRYQAYGHPWIPNDLLEGNLVPDIPESDQWLFNGGWSATQIDQIRYGIFNKYASSAAHLRGLKIASCEAMTNTSGVFSASLEYIKQATDLDIVAGINHLVLHGWNYSPKEADFPGWIRFGTYFSEQNPWFPYLKNWSDYTARICSVFQNTQAVCQVAIIGPTADHWSNTGLDRNPLLLEPWYLHSLWQAMNHHGYCSDYLNPRIFNEATYENGNINYGPMSYQTVVICGMDSASPEFIDALIEYAKTDGKIIFIDALPSKSLGMKFKNDETVSKKISELTAFKNNVHFVNSPKRGDIQELTLWTGKLLKTAKIKPGIEFSYPHEHLYFYQAKYQNNPVFFFSNQNRKGGISFKVRFNTKELNPWLWNAETGEKTPLHINNGLIYFELKTLESALVVFNEEKAHAEKKENSKEKPQSPVKERIVLNNWIAEFIPVEGEPFTIELPELKNLTEINETKNFGGTIIYKTTIADLIKETSKLDIGKVAETAEVTLNGINLGVKWWGEKTYDISSAVKEGKNELEIKVTTLLWNYCNSLSMKENPMAKHWADRNRIKNNKPLPTGLIGPVLIS